MAGGDDRVTRRERARKLFGVDEVEVVEPAGEIAYQHTVLAQTCLPYRNPGDDCRVWQRSNGGIGLRIEAGTVWDLNTGNFVPVGLPFGCKPRLILAFLNGEALRSGSRTIEVAPSLTGFVRAMGFSGHGRDIMTSKEQLSRLSASTMRLGLSLDGVAVTIKSDIVGAFKMWSKEDNHRVRWPETIRLSAEYFESLTRHAVPLHEVSLRALSGNAMALDIYAWLAQRLHRIERGRVVLIAWPLLHMQFGKEYAELFHFKPVYRRTLAMVIRQYRAAQVDLDDEGIHLRHSQPPVAGRTSIVVSKRDPD